jgi:hypothetical protein
MADTFDAALTYPVGDAGFGLDEIEIRCTPCTLTGHGTLPLFIVKRGDHRTANKRGELGSPLDLSGRISFARISRNYENTRISEVRFLGCCRLESREKVSEFLGSLYRFYWVFRQSWVS